MGSTALTYDSVIDKIRTGIERANSTGLSGQDITPETTFWANETTAQTCLWFDSLDFLELVVYLEEELGHRVPEDQIDIDECQTVGDLASLVIAISRKDHDVSGT
ncbi:MULTISPECIES: acyl carrier protein [unclassified Nonomuraea]|uniref:acyl carrier protein n=1 Tax=unclassified Nonomuraea TaxID=2593643 RepID=UPI001376EBAC|nr:MULTISPECIES: phosphopantetheine-binding protein [unclassified Nonomuraea]NBE92572.1 hypothetical protein [Nonomuraea sp. K271]